MATDFDLTGSNCSAMSHCFFWIPGISGDSTAFPARKFLLICNEVSDSMELYDVAPAAEMRDLPLETISNSKGEEPYD